ncbi:NAD-dependent epimerase/dehydratase family protein [Rhizobium bangladeshense]|nr:NAD-dependent epimerase/dehydratase family protein [Rhizobium bangladeshense]
MSKILVTGGSGFVGSHVAAKLLKEGHEVRTTIRSARREAEVRSMVRNGGAESDQALSFSQTDLTDDHGWAAAVSGCDYVLHVASPFPQQAPDNEDELIVPARDGTLRVLRAARDAGVKRVVLTSSFAAIGYGHTNYDKVFDEEDWTDPNGPDVQPYIKSKVLAERAAWDFIDREGGSLEMSVVTFVSNGHVAFSSVQTVLEPFGCSSIERHGWKQKDRDVGLHWPLRHNLAPVVRQSPHPIFISVLHSKIEAVDLPHLADPISIPGLTQ